MKPMHLAVLTVVAIALVVMAIWFGRDGVPQSESPSQGLLWPELGQPVEAVDRIEFRGAGGSTLEALEYRDGAWRVLGHGGWWADAGRVQSLLRDLRRARKLEAKTALPDRYALLGVDDVASADATGTAVGIVQGSRERWLIVGNANPHSSGRFVRFADEAQAWLVDVELDLPADARQWLDREVVDIASLRIARLEIMPDQGEAVVVVRTPGEGPGHALAGAEAGAEVDQARVEEMATLMEGLRLDDVVRDPGTGLGALAMPVHLRLETLDGLVIEGESWREGAVRWLRLDARFDALIARGWVEAEIERDEAALSAASQPAVDGGEAAAAPLDAGSAGLGPMDVEQRLQALQADAHLLAERLEGWVFSLSPRKQAIIETAREDYFLPTD